LSKDIIIFCFRSYNDLDHIVPVVYKLSSSDNKFKIKCIFFNTTRSLMEDYRVKFLIKNNVSVEHVFEYLGASKKEIEKWLDDVSSSLVDYSFFKKVFLYVKRKLSKSRIEKYLSRIDPENIIKKIANGNIVKSIVFDHGCTKIYRSIVDNANKSRIHTIAMPHGLSNMQNNLTQTHMLEQNMPKSIEKLPYRKIIYSEENQKSRAIKAGKVNNEQCLVLGSPRYCEEWSKINDVLLSEYKFYDKEEKFRILILLTKKHNNIFEEEVYRIIKLLSKLDDIKLCVKAHTRGTINKNETIPDNVLIAPHYVPTSYLIRWSDLVLFSSTSAIAECIIKNKPILYLRRTIANKIIMEKYFSSISVDTRDELLEKLDLIKNKQITNTYTEQERDNYIKGMIEPSGVDVLGLYVNYLKSCR